MFELSSDALAKPSEEHQNVVRKHLSSSSKVNEPLLKWKLMREASERAQSRATDFRTFLTAAVKRGDEKEPHAQATPSMSAIGP